MFAMVLPLVPVHAASAAVALPPQLLARLHADSAAASKALVAERARLARAARAQQHAAAQAGRADAQATLVRGVAAAVGIAVPDEARRTLDDRHAATSAALEVAQRALDAATTRTASAQAVALDADRRIRALERASTTEAESSPSGGSWRFGSGGPAVSAATLDAYLASKGSPMAGQGAAFLKSGVRHEVDPRFVVAIAGAESYFGITTCAAYNGWGWGCPSGPVRFGSWAAAIETVTAGLADDYIADGLTTVGEIHLRYAPPDATNDPDDLNYGWADNVAHFLVEQGGDPQAIAGLRGPSA
jgi:hypothetical protein